MGDVANTTEPEPVSSEITPASCAEVVEANWLRGLATFPRRASKVADTSIAGVVPPVEVTLFVVPDTDVTVPAPFPLKVDQSVLESAPRFDADAVGRLKVWVPVPLSTIAKSVPVVPVTRNCAAVVSAFIEVMPEEPPETSTSALPVEGFIFHLVGVNPSTLETPIRVGTSFSSLYALVMLCALN